MIKRAAVLVLCTVLALMAQPKERAKLPPDLEAIFNLAMAAPPEFGASALIRISGRVQDRDLRVELLEMAFNLASGAHIPVRLQAIPGSNIDTRSGYLSKAMLLRLDALSLETQVVDLLLPIDPARARELFQRIPKPTPAVAKCEDPLLPDVSPYYQTLATIAQKGFTAKEHAQSEHVAFLTTAVGRIASIAEIAPAAQLVTGVESRPQFEIATGALISRLQGMPLDSRSFHFFSDDIEQAMTALVARARAFGAPSMPLAEAYRAFLVNQLKGRSCADVVRPAGGFVTGMAGKRLFGDAVRGELPPLTTEEMTPEVREGEMKIDRYWESDEAQRVFEECLKLRRDKGMPISEAVRNSPEWRRQLADFLSSLGSWGPGSEASESDYYHEKAIVYEALLELTPPGETSDKVIASFVDFLKNSNAQQRNTVEWYWHAQETVDRIRPSHPEQAAKLLGAFRGSGSIVLVLESMLDGF